MDRVPACEAEDPGSIPGGRTRFNMSDKKEETRQETKTGRYVYDKKLGKVVKVSDEIPGLKKGASEPGCPMNPGGHTCGGGCGCHG